MRMIQIAECTFEKQCIMYAIKIHTSFIKSFFPKKFPLNGERKFSSDDCTHTHTHRDIRIYLFTSRIKTFPSFARNATTWRRHNWVVAKTSSK